jgi:hypothetical protein
MEREGCLVRPEQDPHGDATGGTQDKEAALALFKGHGRNHQKGGFLFK